jgi:ribosome maturation protein Sdo1
MHRLDTAEIKRIEGWMIVKKQGDLSVGAKRRSKQLEVMQRRIVQCRQRNTVAGSNSRVLVGQLRMDKFLTIT